MLKDTDVHWFPIRINHSSPALLRKLTELLEQEEPVEKTYVPLQFKKKDATTMDFAPAITNFIFIRVSLQHLKSIKSNKAQYEPLRYVMHPVYDENYNQHKEILYVTDKKMDDFIRVVSEANDQVIFLNNLHFACKPGQKVQITEGPFAGVKGTIKSIQKHLCVVIPIEKVTAVAITNIPKRHLRYLTDDECEEACAKNTEEIGRT